jgi:DNA-binding MarR family transcriptional regulator
LIRKRLIERRASDADRRFVQIALSARGKRLVDQFRQRRIHIFSEAFKSLDGEERAQVVASLEKMVTALEGYERKITKKRR